MTPITSHLALSLFALSSAWADLSLFRIPETRGNNNTAYATFDGFSGLSSINATGTTLPEQSSNLTSAALSQTTPLSFPGGLKFTTATNLRVYTFLAAASWQLSAEASVPFQEVTLQVSELLDASRGEEGEVLPGLTGYTVALAGISPTATDVDSFVLGEGTLFERSVEITTFRWSLPTPTTTASITLEGYPDAHDSIDAFSLDLAPAARPTTLAAPEIALRDGQVVLSWPATTEAILQRLAQGEGERSWQPVVAPVTTSEGLHSVILAANKSDFFRLVTP